MAEEYALTFDRGRSKRLLIVPALFDETNRMRRFTVEVMRRLDGAGIDSFLPDLPGTNESQQPLSIQSTEDWRDAMGAASLHFGATHALGIRGGCLFTPGRLPRAHYACAKASSILRQMIRARILSSREAGVEEKREALMEHGLCEGLELAGYSLGAEFLREFDMLQAAPLDSVIEIGQDQIGGSGLWLRAEPGESREQADALAASLSVWLMP